MEKKLKESRATRYKLAEKIEEQHAQLQDTCKNYSKETLALSAQLESSKKADSAHTDRLAEIIEHTQLMAKGRRDRQVAEQPNKMKFAEKERQLNQATLRNTIPNGNFEKRLRYTMAEQGGNICREAKERSETLQRYNV